MGRKSKLPLVLAELRSPTAKKRGLTQIELQERCGISEACVNDHIRALHAKRMVHICGWRTDVGGERGGRYQARYQIGDRPDAPKPEPLTRAEVSRRFRERAKKTGLIEEILAKGRAYWWKRQPPRRDPLAAALFGAPA